MKNLNIKRRVRGQRRGISIMEVMFAIGVLTVGLLGIASVLPVATNTAAKVLERDRAVEQINNQISQELARVGPNSLNSVILPNRSLASFATGGTLLSGQRFVEVDLSGLPPAFCIDPWFLTSANNLRNDTSAMPDTTRNGYDRGLFPCYDGRFNPSLSPADAISTSTGWLTPRFTRVALSGPTASPTFKISRNQARSNDNISLFQPKDTTLPPGLFVQKSSPGGPVAPLVETKVSGRYSSFVMMSRSAVGGTAYNAAIVTLLDRETTIVPGGGPLAFQLDPYTAARADASNPADGALTYSDEVIGFVTVAPRPFVGGGGGEFTYVQSAFMSPEVSTGDWLMLARQHYVNDPNTNTAYDPVSVLNGQALPIEFAWYQVRSVSSEPTLANVSGADVYVTTVSVDGPDWMFSPDSA